MYRFRKGQIVYIQGQYKCKVLSDDKFGVGYIALEGFEESYKGTPLTAGKFLFSAKKDKNLGKN